MIIETGRKKTQNVRFLPSKIKNKKRMGRPNIKFIRFVRTTTVGSTSAGNRIFLIRFPLIIITLELSKREELNHIHGSNPQNKNREYVYGFVSKVGSLGLMIKPKTIV